MLYIMIIVYKIIYVMWCYIVYLQKRIAANITLEQGKTLVDAEGDVMRGLRKCYPDIT